METILVANSGSSSVKFQVFEIDAGHRLVRQIKGKVEGIGTKPHLGASGADGKVLVDQAYENEKVPDGPSAVHAAGDWLCDEIRLVPIRLGYPAGHGGPDY